MKATGTAPKSKPRTLLDLSLKKHTIRLMMHWLTTRGKGADNEVSCFITHLCRAGISASS